MTLMGESVCLSVCSELNLFEFFLDEQTKEKFVFIKDSGKHFVCLYDFSSNHCLLFL